MSKSLCKTCWFGETCPVRDDDTADCACYRPSEAERICGTCKHGEPHAHSGLVRCPAGAAIQHLLPPNNPACPEWAPRHAERTCGTCRHASVGDSAHGRQTFCALMNDGRELSRGVLAYFVREPDAPCWLDDWAPRDGSEPQPQQRKENAVATSGTYMVEVVRVDDAGKVVEQLLAPTTLTLCGSAEEAEYAAIEKVVRAAGAEPCDWKGVVVNVVQPFRA